MTDVRDWVRAQLGKTHVGPKKGVPSHNNNADFTIDKPVTLRVRTASVKGAQDVTVPSGSHLLVYRRTGRSDEAMAVIFMKDENDMTTEQITIQLGGLCIRRRFR